MNEFFIGLDNGELLTYHLEGNQRKTKQTVIERYIFTKVFTRTHYPCNILRPQPNYPCAFSSQYIISVEMNAYLQICYVFVFISHLLTETYFIVACLR